MAVFLSAAELVVRLFVVPSSPRVASFLSSQSSLGTLLVGPGLGWVPRWFIMNPLRKKNPSLILINHHSLTVIELLTHHSEIPFKLDSPSATIMNHYQPVVRRYTGNSLSSWIHCRRLCRADGLPKWAMTGSVEVACSAGFRVDSYGVDTVSSECHWDYMVPGLVV